MTKRTVLIDGDEFIYRATAALEREIKWDENNHVLYANEEQAFDNLKGMIKRIFDRFETKSHYLCFSAPPNFRTKVDETYKNNRANSRKPMCYAALRERVVPVFRCVSFAGLEADDVMGVLATQPGKEQRIIVSQDKDMKTIPAHVWDGKDLTVVSEGDANYMHLFQTLVGDTSDGYKGCPGVGKVKAEKLLTECHYQQQEFNGSDHVGFDVEKAWVIVVKAYEKAGLTVDDAIRQARLARILRWSDWDATKKEPILWQPPK